MEASSSLELWVVRRPLHMECLYAVVYDGLTVTVTQYVLPGFWSYLFPDRGAPPMKGMFAGDKASNPNYRPALDGLAAAEPGLLQSAILACIATGAAVQFSCTRDFGALVVTVLDGNQRAKAYPTDAQEIAQALHDLRDSFTSEPPPQARSSKAR